MFASMSIALCLLSGPKITKDIVYATHGGQEMKLDLYEPQRTDLKPIPLVVVIHGGAWIGGNREDMAGLCQMISDNGMAAATVSYRLAPKSKWPAMLVDCQAAVRFLRADAKRYNINPERFGSLGASAGGHLAMLLAVRPTLTKEAITFTDQSSQVQAVFNIFGPYDLSQDFAQNIAQLLAFQVLGKPYKDAAEEIKEFSPSTYMVGKGLAPVFTLHGDADTLVPVKQAERLTEQLKKNGTLHETIIIKGMKHEIDVNNKEVMDALKRGIVFLKDYLTLLQ